MVCAELSVPGGVHLGIHVSGGKSFVGLLAQINSLKPRSVKMKLAKISTVVAVLSLTATMALAQPPGGGGRGQGRGNRGGMMGGGVMLLASADSPLKMLSDAIDKLTDLTDDQKSKIADIKKDAEPKIKDARDKLTATLTDDQKKAVEDGKAKIKDATGQDRF